MSDFLNNLIARSYGLKPVAQPRLAARFEPPPGSLSFHQPQSAEESASANSEAGMSAPFNGRLAVEPQPFVALTETARLADISTATEAATSDAAPAFHPAGASSFNDVSRTVASPTPASLPPESHSIAAQTAREQYAEQSASGSSFASQEAIESLASRIKQLAREANAAEQDDLRSSAGQGIAAQPRARDADSPAGLAALSDRAVELARRVVTPTKISAQTREGNEPASVSTSSQSNAADAISSPTIRVTIGRIDVRAIMPEAKESSGRAPAPPKHAPLSLDDYLKERDGRRR